jgi:hypothetical protein
VTRPLPRLLATLLLLVVAAAVAADEPDDAAKKKADLLLRMQTKRAIHRGAKWIAGLQRRDGSFRLDGNQQQGPFPMSRHGYGVTALCLYTLADCGYAADHAVVKRALAYVRKHYGSYMKGDHWPQASSYSQSLVVLALHTLYVKPGRRDATVDHDRYGRRKATEKNPCGYPEWARKTIKEILDWLIENQAREGLFRYPGGLPGSGDDDPRGPNFAGPEDLSNSQYVLLALWAGSRCGYEIKVKTLETIARRLLAIQAQTGPRVAREEDPQPAAEKKGDAGRPRYAEPSGPKPDAVEDRARGFSYTPGEDRVTGSMTTAGLSSLAIVKAMLRERKALRPKLEKELDRGLWDAIAWLARNYDLRSNPPVGSTWHYYYLYGLERACVIAGKRYLGKHDWYREGARMLVDAQKKDGRWNPPGQLGGFAAGPAGASPYRTDVLDTCFALLFLKRATIVPKSPVLEDEPGPVTTPSGGVK